jgi:EF-hand domain-containing protein 1
VPLKKPAPAVLYQAIPSHTGYGTEEDAMGSVVALQPKPPKYDMKKMFKSDMHVLRFNARLVSTEPDDECRTFIISYYCGNDTIQVYEVCDKNSGRIGGPFIQRQKQKNPSNGSYYLESDFLIGRTIFLSGFKFMLVSTDEYTAKYMEDNSEAFPEASLAAIFSKVLAPARNFPSLQDFAVDLLSKLDKNGDQVLDFSEFTAGLRSLNIHVTNHEETALMRRFDANGDGKISMEEFYNTLAKCF